MTELKACTILLLRENYVLTAHEQRSSSLGKVPRAMISGGVDTD